MIHIVEQRFVVFEGRLLEAEIVAAYDFGSEMADVEFHCSSSELCYFMLEVREHSLWI